MPVKRALLKRSDSHCELCQSTDNLCVFEVAPVDSADSDKCILTCGYCFGQLSNSQAIDNNHWRCLNDSMWSTVPAVQVTAWRMLKRLSQEAWAQELSEMLYLDDELLAWAEAGVMDSDDEPTLDSHGAQLQAGDNVTLIKDLEVKGANFTAKRGTSVRNISLTANPEQIEGRVNGTRIVLLTKFLKKLS